MALENPSDKILERFFEKSFYLFRITSKTIFQEVTQVIKNILNSEKISLQKKTTILKEINNWLKKNDN